LAQHSRDTLPGVDPGDARFHSQGDGRVAQESAEEARLVSLSVYTRQAQKDARKSASANLRPQAERLLGIIAKNPFQSPPRDEKLIGDLAGAYSRRINIQHRLIYQVYRAERTIKVIRMWTHYE
jgi:toxin YoeB